MGLMRRLYRSEAENRLTMHLGASPPQRVRLMRAGTIVQSIFLMRLRKRMASAPRQFLVTMKILC
jgi:hypothetical protein